MAFCLLWLSFGVVAWLAPGPPIYDGIGFPDEPYRYVTPPPGAPASSPPTNADTEFPVAGSTNAGSVTNYTAERGPQALVLLTRGSVVIPGSGPVATLRLSPRAPHGSSPDGSIVGNAYDVSVSSGGNAGRLRDGAAAYVQMRVPLGIEPPVALYVSNGGQWHALPTKRTGNDIYSARLPAFGEVVAVHMTNALAVHRYAANGPPGSEPELLAIGAGVVIAAIAAVLVIRRRGSVDAGPE